MFYVIEITTGTRVAAFRNEQRAWSHAEHLNDEFYESLGFEYSVEASD